MGFEVRGATVALQFAKGTLLEGASVRCTLDMSVRDFVQMQRLWAAVGEGDLSQMDAAFRMFGNLALSEWDLVLDGQPLPADGEGLSLVPMAVANAIFKAWSDVVAARDPNSNAASASGNTSGAVSERTGA